MEERDTDWERAHLRVERNGVRVGDTDWEKALLRVEKNELRKEMSTGRERT